jgi:transposase
MINPKSLSRQRDTLAKELKRLQNVGISNARYYGYELKTSWWKSINFKKLVEDLPEYLIALLTPFQAVLAAIDKQFREATAREERTANRQLPVGLGALTASVLDNEFGDYTRFNNRREVASYTGLCPGEASSGGTRKQGSINKHGNPRIRHTLIEAVWRFLQFQPDYEPIKNWKQRMSSEPFAVAKKKKMIVAVARRFAVDWWRINTGQIQPEAVGLKVAYPTAYATRALREGRTSKVYAKTA